MLDHMMSDEEIQKITGFLTEEEKDKYRTLLTKCNWNAITFVLRKKRIKRADASAQIGIAPEELKEYQYSGDNNSYWPMDNTSYALFLRWADSNSHLHQIYDALLLEHQNDIFKKEYDEKINTLCGNGSCRYYDPRTTASIKDIKVNYKGKSKELDRIIFSFENVSNENEIPPKNNAGKFYIYSKEDLKSIANSLSCKYLNADENQLLTTRNNTPNHIKNYKHVCSMFNLINVYGRLLFHVSPYYNITHVYYNAVGKAAFVFDRYDLNTAPWNNKLTVDSWVMKSSMVKEFSDKIYELNETFNSVKEK